MTGKHKHETGATPPRAEHLAAEHEELPDLHCASSEMTQGGALPPAAQDAEDAGDTGERAPFRVDWRKVAFFASLCFALSVLENTIPRPLPFLRVGLANLPILLSFGVMKRRECVALIFCKILLQNVVQGTLFSYVFVFSFCGSLASGLFMLAVYFLFGEHISLLGVCVAGALANNAVQLALAGVFMFGSGVRYIAPVLLCASLATSCALGSAAASFARVSVWYKTLAGGSPAVDAGGSQEEKPRFNALNLVLSAAAFFVLIFFANIYTVYVIFFLFGIMLSIKQRRLNPMPSAFLIFFVTLFSLFDPEGRVLFHVGSFIVTKDAAIEGLLRGGRLRSFVSVSQFLMLENAVFPTKGGAFFSLCTRYFGRLSQIRYNFRKKGADAARAPAQTHRESTQKRKKKFKGSAGRFLAAVDRRLCEVWNAAPDSAAPASPPASAPRESAQPEAGSAPAPAETAADSAPAEVPPTA